MTSWTEIMTSQPLFQNTYILRRPRVANFADNIKVTTMFMKTTFKDSKKIKRIGNCIKMLLLTSGEKLMSAELKGCVT